jgi:general secretion pathway protein H
MTVQATSFRNRGFTILEMLVVLAVVAIIGSGVLANRRLSPGMQVEIAARDIISLMREARGQAIASNETVVVLFDPSRRSIVSGARNLMLSEKQSLLVTAADVERAGEDVIGIRFLPTGRATGGEIKVSEGANSATIRVDWLLGEARLLKSSGVP